MRRCRFEDGSGYIVQAHDANDILGFIKYQNAFKSVDEYDQKKTDFRFMIFFSFHHRVVKKKGSINSRGKGREKKIANLQKA